MIVFGGQTTNNIRLKDRKQCFFVFRLQAIWGLQDPSLPTLHIGAIANGKSAVASDFFDAIRPIKTNSFPSIRFVHMSKAIVDKLYPERVFGFLTVFIAYDDSVLD